MKKLYKIIIFLFISFSTFSQNAIDPEFIPPEEVFHFEEESSNEKEVADKVFLKSLPESYEKMNAEDLKKLRSDIEIQLNKLISEKEELIKNRASENIIESKNESIKVLGKEKSIVDLTIKSEELIEESIELEKRKKLLKNFLIGSLIFIFLLILLIITLLQRKTIKTQDVEIESQLKDIIKKNSFLDFAARIIRHDMHSGINTYIPRGISSLEKRLSEKDIKELNIESPIKMIRDGLSHTQKVYKIVYEFTNLVKHNPVLTKEKVSLNETIDKFISKTSYHRYVEISENLPTIEINEILFWNSLDSIIKNGLKYNDNEFKKVKIYSKSNDSIIIEDNGRGFSNDEFIKYLYSPELGEESSLGLKIANAIINEHGFKLSCEKVDSGTKFKINFN